MSARVLSESALRVSDCVTELLRKQPFFGSLVLRLPLLPDATRETLATDGHEIRYSPRWVAETASHLIETAMARVVMACALKHHTRRGERDPERWQRASQLVTHALIRDAGFTLPPGAEAWEDLSVEQAYERLQTEDGDSGDGGGAPSADPAAMAAGQPSGAGDDDGDPTGDPSASPDDADAHDGDGQGGDGAADDAGSDAPPSFDPSGTGEVMDADARAGEDGEPAEAPLDVTAEEQAWDEAMHQALNIARAEGKVPGGVEETVKNAHASTLDWRTLLRRYMTDATRSDYSWSLPNRRFIDSGLYLPSIHSDGIETIAVIVDTSGSLPAATLAEFWAELREVAAEIGPQTVVVLQVDAAVRDAAEYAPTTCPTRLRSRAGAAPTSARASNGSMRRGSSPGCASTSRTWSAPTTPRPSRPTRPCGSTIRPRPRTGTASPGASASTSRLELRTAGGACAAPPGTRSVGTSAPSPHSIDHPPPARQDP